MVTTETVTEETPAENPVDEKDTPSGDTTAESTGEEETPKTYSQEEHDEGIKRGTQAEVDKRLKPLYDEIKTHKTTIAGLERQAARKGQDASLTRLETRETEHFGQEEDLSDIHSTRRDAIKMIHDAEDMKAEQDERAVTFEGFEKEYKALQRLQPLLWGTDAGEIANVQGLVARMTAATTDEHQEAIFTIICSELKDWAAAQAAKDKDERRKQRNPLASDPSTPSGGGGKDTSAMSGRDKIREGLRLKAEKENQ